MNALASDVTPNLSTRDVLQQLHELTQRLDAAAAAVEHDFEGESADDA